MAVSEAQKRATAKYLAKRKANGLGTLASVKKSVQAYYERKKQDDEPTPQQEYYERNKEKLKEYYDTHKDVVSDTMKRYYERNKERIIARQSKWQKKNNIQKRINKIQAKIDTCKDVLQINDWQNDITELKKIQESI